MKTHTSHLVFDTRSILGEGPVWDWKRQTLFWVDIEGNRLYRYHLTSSQTNHWDFDGMLGAAVPTEDGGMLLALENGLAIFDFESEKLTHYPVLGNTDPMMRYNDGKVDPNGRFWIGSMHKNVAPKTGNLYRIDADWNVSLHIPETTISNGMAWTGDQKTFFYIDTATYQVWRFAYNNDLGTIENKKEAFAIPKSFGGADGMAIDAEDKLWIAHWGGHCVRRWDPDTGEVLEQVEVDAPHVTSCCFGGKNLDTLYITSARSGLTAEQLKKHPKSGGLFMYKPEVVGTPINYFKNS